MKQSDFDAFHALLTSCLSMWDKAPTAAVSAVWFRSLAEFDIQALSTAFSAHMRDPVNGKFEPKPAHIIEQIDRAAKNDGRPGPEEAWSISLTARDEADTVVWTNECAKAWGSAAPIMELGDEVGARMAFKETYARLVAEARARREPASWELSEGFDKDRRRAAIARAVEDGRIPANRYGSIDYTPTLLLGGPSAGMPDAARQKFDELRKKWSAQSDAPSDADVERERLAQLKSESAEKVRRFEGA
jgi:hypothetical protein